jgi:AcrR family transcriptional regulator
MAGGGSPRQRRSATTSLGSRRDEILVAATKLFRQNGFSAVTVDEIGAAVGVTGPALYRHFASKEEILVSVLTAAGDRIAADARRISRAEPSPRAALRSIVRSYLAEVIPHRRLVGSYLQGTAFAADSATAAPLRDRQRKYLHHVSTVLRRARPELSPTEAQTLVHATFGVLNSVAWSDAAIDKGAADLLESAAMATLFSGVSASPSSNRAARRSRIRATA